MAYTIMLFVHAVKSISYHVYYMEKTTAQAFQKRFHRGNFIVV